MPYTQLFIWVEGDDDVRFFEHVVKPMFLQTYDWVEVRAYRREKKARVSAFLASIKAMHADYIFVGDLDRAPCVTARRLAIAADYSGVDPERIAVVVREIECWYLAGLDASCCRRFGLPSMRSTDDANKELFNRGLRKTFDSRTDFMLEILKSYSVAAARRKNRSFRYFVTKFGAMA